MPESTPVPPAPPATTATSAPPSTPVKPAASASAVASTTAACADNEQAPARENAAGASTALSQQPVAPPDDDDDEVEEGHIPAPRPKKPNRMPDPQSNEPPAIPVAEDAGGKPVPVAPRTKAPSSAQARANAANAQRSTGPRTADGKARVRLNAVKHGLTAATHFLLPDEEAEEFAALRQAAGAQFLPSTVFEQMLVDRIARCMWKTLRYDRYATLIERAATQYAAPDAVQGEDDVDEADLMALALGRALSELFGSSSALGNLNKLAVANQRDLDRLIAQLKAPSAEE